MSEEKKFNTQNLKPWVKGQSGNADGRPAVPEDVKRIRKLTNEEIKEVGTLLLNGKQSELEAMVADDETPILKKWMASLSLQGLKTGDERKLDAILNRIVGKVKDEVDVNLIPRPVIIERHDGSTVELTTERKEIEE